MTVEPPSSGPKAGAPVAQPSRKDQRLARQKAALKANMARRKAQVRAKAGQGDPVGHNEKDEKPE